MGRPALSSGASRLWLPDLKRESCSKNLNMLGCLENEVRPGHYLGRPQASWAMSPLPTWNSHSEEREEAG